MLLLHGTWLVSGPSNKTNGFVIWAETDQTREMSARPLPHLHPFSANIPTLRRALTALVPLRAQFLHQAAAEYTTNVWLPSHADSPQSSAPVLQIALSPAPPAQLGSWQTEGLRLAPPDVPAFLTALPNDADETPGILMGADLKFWRAAGRFALELLARQRFMPTLQADGEKFLALWKPLLDEPNDRARMERLVRAMPPACRALVPRKSNEVNALAPRVILENFLATVLDAFVRAKDVPHVPKSQPLSGTTAEAWVSALTASQPVVQAAAPELNALYEQYQAWAETFPGAGADDSFRLCFRLDPPPIPETPAVALPKTQARDWQLHYFLQATDDPSLLVPAADVWQARGRALQFFNRKFDAPQERLLAGLGHASRLFPPIEQSLHSAHPSQAALNLEEAYTFIRETALLLQSFGFGVLVPGLKAQLGVRVKLKSASAKAPKGGVAGISFEDVVNYDWQVVLGESTLSRAEFEKLAALKTPLVQIRGQWVELHPEQMQAALKFWDKRKHAGEMSAQEALQLALAQATNRDVVGLPIAEVEADGWFGDVLNTLRDGAKLETVTIPPTFQGTLRHYQIDGVSWLAFLRQWSLGGILADDMGLGKTPQTIALLLQQRTVNTQATRPTLIICPTSVVSNWERELARFAPSLRVYAHHGAARKKNDLAAHALEHDVILSSYALLQRDEKHLAAIQWDNLILDEAQNIKNPSTKQAQAARKLDTRWRLTLTGTPVENRLGELWSLFQFLNPGYLGSRNDFQKRFANPIERAGDADVTQQLKQLTAPFILRRLKTDSKVIQDLPAKNEMKVLVNLTREQATLYEAVVRDSLQRIEESEGMARRGIVLATLTRLKQVCNHPAQFLGDGSALGGRSGKLMRLNEMLDEVRGARERVLVFTQFAEMGKLLQTYLQATMETEVAFLHGGTPAKARPSLIDRFQNDPNGPWIFILSIKAGGTGLNLTRANHVFHFDRWWNPAVENQATDRAFRIGQTKNVQVYKYICAGTFEEQIDAMIERKQKLASSIVGTSEGWLTELGTDELRNLFKLRQDAMGD